MLFQDSCYAAEQAVALIATEGLVEDSEPVHIPERDSENLVIGNLQIPYILFKMHTVVESGESIVVGGIQDFLLVLLAFSDVDGHAQGLNIFHILGGEDGEGEIGPKDLSILADESLVYRQNSSLFVQKTLGGHSAERFVLRMGELIPTPSQHLFPGISKHVGIALVDVLDPAAFNIGKGHADRGLFEHGLEQSFALFQLGDCENPPGLAEKQETEQIGSYGIDNKNRERHDADNRPTDV